MTGLGTPDTKLSDQKWAVGGIALAAAANLGASGVRRRDHAKSSQ